TATVDAAVAVASAPNSATASLLSPTPTLHSSTSSLTSPAVDDDDDDDDDDASTNQSVTPSPSPSPFKGSVVPVAPPAAVVSDDDEDDDEEAENVKPAHMSGNEWRARRAVRHAVCNNDTFDRFDVLAIVGYGSNGAVVSARPRARDAPAGVLLAIKIIYKSKATSSTSTNATGDVVGTANDPWPHEVLLHRRLSAHHAHPGMLHSHAHFQDERHFYLVMDLVDADWLARFADPSSGGVVSSFAFVAPRTRTRHRVLVCPGGKADLWAWSVDATTPPGAEANPVASQVLPPREACRAIFRDVALALRHLHRLGVHHGDIKPENVLVSPATSGAGAAAVHARLCDFGHARHSPALDAPEHRLASYGTRELSAPELLPNLAVGAAGSTRRIRLDAFRLDVYALGLLLFTLLHGPARLPATAAASTRAAAAMPLDRLLRDYTGVDPRATIYRLAGADVDAKHWRLPGLLDRDMHPDVAADPQLVGLLSGMLCVDPKRRMTVEDVCAHPWVAEA
ncbi:Checkpoint kinase 2, partial [Cladochytrium tenue]